MVDVVKRKFVVAIPPSPVLRATMDSAAALAEGEGHRVVRPPSDADAPNFLNEIDILLLTPRFGFDYRLLAKSPKLRCVLFPTIGVDPFDLASATDAGILVGHSAPPIAIDSMAQAAVALIASVMLRLPQKSEVLAKGGWREPYVVGRTLVGRTVGLVGYGRIGRATAKLLGPWGARIVFSDPLVKTPQDGAMPLPLDELLRQSDIVSIHASRSGDGGFLIGRREITLMRRDACLVNTSRGGLVDEAAIADALEDGQVAAAALDAFDAEPLPASSRLRRAPNALLTPHSAGHTEELLDGLTDEFLENLGRVLRGGAPLNVANPAALPKWQGRFCSGSGLSGAFDD